jgi:hypothetical protein
VSPDPTQGWPSSVRPLVDPHPCRVLGGTWTLPSLSGPDRCRYVVPGDTCLRLTEACTSERNGMMVALFLLSDGEVVWLLLTSMQRS